MRISLILEKMGKDARFFFFGEMSAYKIEKSRQKLLNMQM